MMNASIENGRDRAKIRTYAKRCIHNEYTRSSVHAPSPWDATLQGGAGKCCCAETMNGAVLLDRAGRADQEPLRQGPLSAIQEKL
jgi:hypothetical protein